jgi:nicotinate phosphoribosyltransferase
MKFSNGKVSLPGRKQIVRFEKDGAFDHDILQELGEPTPPGGKALLETAMVDGKRVIPRASVGEQRQATLAELLKLPRRLFSLTGEGIEPYSVRISDGLKTRQERASARLKSKETQDGNHRDFS